MLQTANTFAKHGKLWIIALVGVGLASLGISTAHFLRQADLQKSPPENSAAAKAEIEAVSALGRIEPQGEVIQLAPAPSMAGAKVEKLLVKEGDRVKAGQLIAITHENATKLAELATAEREVTVARANLAIVKAGAKRGEIEAQQATIAKLKAQLAGEIATNDAKIARLEAQLAAEKQEKQAEIQRLKAELTNAQLEWNRYRQLAAEGAISQSNLDAKRLVFDTARESLEEARASYQKSVATLTEEIREMEAFAAQTVNTLEQQIAQAQADLAKIAEIRAVDVDRDAAEVERAIARWGQVKTELELTYIKTPQDGQIIKIKAYPGENIDSEEGVVELGNTDKMLVIAEVYESDLGKVKIGQQASIQSENGAFNGEIQGKVIDIGRQVGKKDVLDTDPAADVDARVVEVKIAVDRQDTSKIYNLIYSKVLVKILL